jgi:steroid 5-alpha reductase family enzyme
MNTGLRSLGTKVQRVALLVVLGTYVVAGVGAALTAAATNDLHPLAGTLGADIVATLVVFAATMLARNASLYDPYWSVAPPVIAVAWVSVVGGGVPARQVLVVALVLLWGIRLTANWVSAWHGLRHEDWRYVQLRQQTAGRVPWWLVNLGGIQLMPTLIVFLGLLPVWPALTVPGRAVGGLDVVAAAVTLAAVGLEATADAQLHRFAAEEANHGQIMARGVWRFSRHPNYLGEIGFWCGLWLFGVAAAPGWWWTIVGPAAMVVLFLGASIPLMDKRSLARRPGYAEHMRRVPALLPRPRRSDPAQPRR